MHVRGVRPQRCHHSRRAPSSGACPYHEATATAPLLTYVLVRCCLSAWLQCGGFSKEELDVLIGMVEKEGRIFIDGDRVYWC